MRIAIIGTGYVGLVTGVCLAINGHSIVCVDLCDSLVSKLNQGIPHIFEEGLDSLLTKVIASKSFAVTTNVVNALDHCEVVFLAVGTPSHNGEIDLSQVAVAARLIGEYIKSSKKHLSIVVKSTVVPGTTDSYVREIVEKASSKKLGDFGLGMNPEFLREGSAVKDFQNPDRIVIGYEDNKTKERLEEIYSPWSCDKLYVNTRTAEMIKYANNTLLASLISLNNELANLASAIGNIDYQDVVQGISTDRRWCPLLENGERVKPTITDYLIPGAGFGGSCFPKDLQAIKMHGIKAGLSMAMTSSVLDVNEKQAMSCIELLRGRMGSLNGVSVLFLGLSFKPGTDDIRHSSAIKILEHLLEEKCCVTAHDPIAMPKLKSDYIDKPVTFTSNWQAELENIDVIVIGTNWPEYKILSEYDKNGILENKLIYDTKRLFSKEEIQSANYLTIGYAPASKVR